MSDTARPRTMGEKYQLWARRQTTDSPSFSEAVSSDILPRVGPWAVFTQGAPQMMKASLAFMALLTYVVMTIALVQGGGAGLVNLAQLRLLEAFLPFAAGACALIAGFAFIYLQFAMREKIWRQVEPAIIRNPETGETYMSILRIMDKPMRVHTPSPEKIAERLRSQRREPDEDTPLEVLSRAPTAIRGPERRGLYVMPTMPQRLDAIGSLMELLGGADE